MMRQGNGKISKDELSTFVVQDTGVQEVLGTEGFEVDEILTQVLSHLLNMLRPCQNSMTGCDHLRGELRERKR